MQLLKMIKLVSGLLTIALLVCTPGLVSVLAAPVDEEQAMPVEETPVPEVETPGQKTPMTEQTNRITDLSLGLGQAAILHYVHLSEGAIQWLVDVTPSDEQLQLQFSVVTPSPGTGEPAALYSEVIRGTGASGTLDLAPAGDLWLVLTPKPTEASNQEKAFQSSLLLSLQVTGDLESNQDRPPVLLIKQPSGHAAVFGQEEYINFQLVTEPFLPVYFGTSEEPVNADASGLVSHWMKLGSGLINTLQAFVVGPSGHITSVVTTVSKHFVAEDPTVSLLLNPRSRIVVQVPDVTLVDLTRSSLQLDGQPLPLRADPTHQQLYVNPGLLAVGLHQLHMELFSLPDENTGQAVWLDSVNWQVSVPGTRTAVFTPGSKECAVNGQQLPLDAPIYLNAANSSYMIPFRFLGDILGAEVNWQGGGVVTFQLGDQTVLLNLGQRVALVNGNPVSLPVAPSAINGRTMVPLRFVIENLGASVIWDRQTGKVTVYAAIM
jgi:hypothetical protein